MYEETTLNNSVKVCTFFMKEMNSAAVGVWLRAGSRYENKRNNGISHFLEHLVFKGTKKRSSRKIKQDVEGSGGSLNAFTSEECTCYFAKVVSKKFAVALDVLADIVINPILKQKDIEMERNVIKEEIRRQFDNPSQLVHLIFDELFFPSHPLGFPVAGVESSVSSITRTDLANYRRSSYSGRNLVITAAGNVKHNDVLSEVKRHFGKCGAGRVGKFSRVKIRQRAPRVKVEKKDLQQTHLCLGVHSFPFNHPDKYALGVLNVILGGNMSSRLFEEVREKRGLAYSIGSFVRSYADTGAFIISAGVDAAKTQEAVDVVLGEMNKLKKKDVSSRELNRAREFYTGQLLLAMEDTNNRMLWMGESMLSLGRLLTVEEILEGVRDVEFSDVKRVAEKLFTGGNLNLAVLGPLKENIEVQL